MSSFTLHHKRLPLTLFLSQLFIEISGVVENGAKANKLQVKNYGFIS